MTLTKIVAGFSVTIIALTATLAGAEEEHWLTYRTSAHPQRAIGNVSSAQLSQQTDRPDGLELPELTAEDPLFAKWPTPMVEAGHVWLVFDRSKVRRQYDRLYIDSNCDGSLADETAIKPVSARRYGRGNAQAQFAPVEVWLQGDDGPVAYALNVQLYERAEGRHHLRATSACWYQGQFELAGKMRQCTLVDYNCNGTFNDSSVQFQNVDRIRLGAGSSVVEHFVGKYMQIDGTLYEPKIAPDGAFIAVSPAEGVILGAVKAPENLTKLTVGGEGGLVQLALVDGVGQLPVGKWAVYEWQIEREDEKGAKWKLVGKGAAGNVTFEVAKDEAIELAVGEPITGVVSDRANGKRHNFSQSLKGRMGERIELTRNGQRPGAPKLRIVSEDETYDKVFRFEYG